MCSKPWGPILESYAAASCARICLLASPQSTLQDKITAQELLDLCGADVALAVAVIAEAFLRDASVRFNPGFVRCTTYLELTQWVIYYVEFTRSGIGFCFI